MAQSNRSNYLAKATLAVWLLSGFLPLEAAAKSENASGCAGSPPGSKLVNVKHKGALGDGRTDDSDAIQAAIDEIAGTGGTVLVPDGIYMVNAANTKHRLSLRDNMTLKLAPGATLKAIPNGEEIYALLTIANVSNVKVVGGSLEGERDKHSGNAGEFGMGIWIGPGAKHVTIRDVTSSNMWGDGFFIGGAVDVALCSVTANRNRRQGLSITEADGVVISNSVFSNTSGTRPSAGIDLEPDTLDQKVSNILIERSKFINNAGGGVLISGKKHQSLILNVKIAYNLFTSTTPIKIEYSPAVLDSAICHNRQVISQPDSSGGMSPFSSPVSVIVNQSECGDPRILIRR